VVDSLGAGQQQAFAITAQVAADVGANETLTNKVETWGASQPATVNERRVYTDTAQGAATTGFPDLVIRKECGTELVAPGQPIAYTIVYTNEGAVRAEGVWISDTLPLLLADPVDASSRPATVEHAGRVITWRLTAPLSPTLSGRIWITATVSPDAQDGDVLVNTVGIGTATQEPGTANNTAEVSSPIGCRQVSGLAFVYSPAAPVVGQTIVFTGTAAAGSGVPIDYTWNFGDGEQVVQTGVMTTTTFAAHAYGDGDAYVVTLTAVNVCGESRTQRTVIINPHRIYLPTIMRH
jgi:uncharacterized repeat protein (TIGR01451 family)